MGGQADERGRDRRRQAGRLGTWRDSLQNSLEIHDTITQTLGTLEAIYSAPSAMKHFLHRLVSIPLLCFLHATLPFQSNFRLPSLLSHGVSVMLSDDKFECDDEEKKGRSRKWRRLIDFSL